MANDAAEKKDTTGGIAMLFELENTALQGRQRLFEIVRKQAAGSGVKLDASQFIRNGLKSAADQSLAGILAANGVAKGEAAKAAEEAASIYAADIRTGKVALQPSVVKLLQTAARKGCILGALSVLEETDAQAAIERLELGVEVKLLAHKPTEPAFPRPDLWYKLLKIAGHQNGAAVAVVSSLVACKSALAAGLRCIVVPDAYTSFQDFSGADIVVDSAEAVNASEILSELGIR